MNSNFTDLRDHNAEYFMFLMGSGGHFYTKVLILTTEIGLPPLARGQANLHPPLAKVHAWQILVSQGDEKIKL